MWISPFWIRLPHTSTIEVEFTGTVSFISENQNVVADCCCVLFSFCDEVENEETDLPITAWEAAVDAHDGSISGYREVNDAG